MKFIQNMGASVLVQVQQFGIIAILILLHYMMQVTIKSQQRVINTRLKAYIYLIMSMFL